MARAIDADRLADGLELHRQSTDQKHEADRQWAVGYNAGLDRALYSIAYAPTLTQPNEPLTVAEVCPHCESEITMEWNVKTLGYKAYCPVCGNRLMLCDECQHGEPGHICDYDSNKDTCRFNRRPPEGEA